MPRKPVVWAQELVLSFVGALVIFVPWRSGWQREWRRGLPGRLILCGVLFVHADQDLTGRGL